MHTRCSARIHWSGNFIYWAGHDRHFEWLSPKLGHCCAIAVPLLCRRMDRAHFQVRTDQPGRSRVATSRTSLAILLMAHVGVAPLGFVSNTPLTTILSLSERYVLTRSRRSRKLVVKELHVVISTFEISDLASSTASSKSKKFFNMLLAQHSVVLMKTLVVAHFARAEVSPFAKMFADPIFA